MPLLEAMVDNVGRRTAFLFNPINTPVSSQKVPLSSYIIPSGMTLAQFAKQAIQAPNTPFLLLIDDNAPLVTDIKSLYQTFKVGSVEVTQSAISVIPQFPLQPAVVPVHTGYYQPQYSVPSHSQVPTVSGGGSFPSLPVASTVSVSEVTSSAVSQNNPQNVATSSATPDNLNISSNQATVPLSAAQEVNHE